MKYDRDGQWLDAVILNVNEALTMAHVLFANRSSGTRELKRRWVDLADLDFNVKENESSTQDVGLPIDDVDLDFNVKENGSSTQDVGLPIDDNSVGRVSNYLLHALTLLRTEDLATVTYQDVLRDRSLCSSLFIRRIFVCLRFHTYKADAVRRNSAMHVE